MATATRYSTAVVVEHDDPLSDVQTTDKGQALTKLGNWFHGLAAGMVRSSKLDLFQNAAQAKRAFGYVVLSSGSGALTIVINGVTSGSETHATSDAATAALLSADINADATALVSGFVESSVCNASVALASVAAGEQVFIKLSDGTLFRFTAHATVTADGQFAISGNDTADGTELATVINNTPILNYHVYALNTSGTVTIFQRRGGATVNFTLWTQGAGLTPTANAATATIGVSAIPAGQIGNCFTLAVTGTGMTASGARLVGGTGGAAAVTLATYRT